MPINSPVLSLAHLRVKQPLFTSKPFLRKILKTLLYISGHVNCEYNPVFSQSSIFATQRGIRYSTLLPMADNASIRLSIWRSR